MVTRLPCGWQLPFEQRVGNENRDDTQEQVTNENPAKSPVIATGLFAFAVESYAVLASLKRCHCSVST